MRNKHWELVYMLASIEFIIESIGIVFFSFLRVYIKA